MSKPEIKREVALDYIVPFLNQIVFYSTPDALKDFSEYGDIASTGRANQYNLCVDSRFDFQEVVDYIKIYG